MDQERIKAAVTELLLAVGEDPEREGLLETPDRVVKIYVRIFSGLEEDPMEHLKIFQGPQQHGELILVRDIPLYFVREHHLLPFVGKVHIAYIPKDGRIIGLSKFAWVVGTFTSRSQAQERLTTQIAGFLFDNPKPYGVAVVVEAEHLCVMIRGIHAAGTVTQTSALRGAMRTKMKTRSEVMSLLVGGGRRWVNPRWENISFH